MKKSSFFLLLICFFSLSSLSFAEQEFPLRGKDFFVLTIPKSGSHLLAKLLYMMTGKKHIFPSRVFPQCNFYSFCDEIPEAYVPDQQMEAAFIQWKLDKRFPLGHFNCSENFYQFSLNHPEYVKIVEIRDLRDVCVSCVFRSEKAIEDEIGPCSFDEKLMFVITLGNKPTKNHFIPINKHAEKALIWMNDPSVVVCRFENLVGEQGGGTEASQKRQILRIARKLNITLLKEELEGISANLYGIENGPDLPKTFRQGQIGGWKNHFKEEHKMAFKQYLGDLQLKMGYTLDD